jgi:aryl-alcohol dehydrogenase-like predicted oxidoreductase
VPIVGARTREQLAENAGVTDVSITDDQRRRITDARYAEDGRRWGH